jgi:hypothetical protein
MRSAHAIFLIPKALSLLDFPQFQTAYLEQLIGALSEKEATDPQHSTSLFLPIGAKVPRLLRCRICCGHLTA